ncbi:MAG: hypothetical protein ACI9BW_004271 [Gammaproteobacteria bacterium]|jgi:hypothetical protein
MLKIIALIVFAALATVLTLAAFQPDSIHIERSIKIKAPEDLVFQKINDLHEWETWSPWAKKDPTMTVTYSGANSGIGAIYTWSGNSDVGKGRMEITDMSPTSRINIKLDFLEPFKVRNAVEFRLDSDDGFTNTRWSMQGPMPFTSKVFNVFVDMDKMIGGDFETGLANLKAIAEK